MCLGNRNVKHLLWHAFCNFHLLLQTFCISLPSEIPSAIFFYHFHFLSFLSPQLLSPPSLFLLFIFSFSPFFCVFLHLKLWFFTPKLWFLSQIPWQRYHICVPLQVCISISCSWWKNIPKLSFLSENSMSANSFSLWLLTIQKFKFFLFCFLTSHNTFAIVCREGERTLKLRFLSPKSFDFYLKQICFLYFSAFFYI